MTDHAKLVEILATTRCILLDFDGPVCDVFAGLPASTVAETLRQTLAARLTGPLPAEVETTDDPLVIVRQVAETAPQLSREIDNGLRRAELRAVASAVLTPGVAEFLAVCHAASRPVAIVSNNSAPAIDAFLARHDLTGYVKHVQGRDRDDPRRMKPDPFLLAEAIAALGSDPQAAVLIGDSTTDVDAGRAHHVRVIGYVNKPEKHQTLSDADALITDMHELVQAGAASGFATPGRN